MRAVVVLGLLCTAAAGEPMRLSLDDAVAMAIESNLEIAVERLGPAIAEADLLAARAAFEPAAQLSFMRTETEQQAPTQLVGANVGISERSDLSAGVSEHLPTGADLGLYYEQSRAWSNSFFQTINPTYGRSVELRLTQPLLDGAGFGVNRAGIVVAAEGLRISHAELRSRVSDVVEDVVGLYWELVFAREDLRVKRVSLHRAEDLLESNRARVEAGLMEPIELIAAEAGLATRRVAVIRAEEALHDAQDRFCAGVGLPLSTELAPVDEPVERPFTMDEKAALDLALSRRPEVAAAAAAIKQAEENLRLARSGVLPDVDLVGSYGWSGLGDTRAVAESALTDRDYRSWSAGVQVTIPLGNRSARGQLRRAQAERDRAVIALHQVQRDISVEVRGALRQLRTDARRIQAQRKVKQLQAEKLERERKRLDAGLSTSHDVLTYEEELAKAESDEMRALIDYERSYAALQRALGSILSDYNVRLGDEVEEDKGKG